MTINDGNKTFGQGKSKLKTKNKIKIRHVSIASELSCSFNDDELDCGCFDCDIQ